MPGQFTNARVLGAPDTEWKELVRDFSLIQTVDAKSDDRGRTFLDIGIRPIQNVSSERVMVRYKDDGGGDMDGTIQLRRGVKELDIGGARYAQVRIGVDGTRYMKGMAFYSDDMPDGIDIIYNTNKHPTGDKLDAMKKQTADPKHPFGTVDENCRMTKLGATIKPGGQRGALNIIQEEGDWNKWSKSLSSQALSKQPVPLAKQQLDIALKRRRDEHDEIAKLTNPVLKKRLMLAFADGCDSAAVHLKAAGLPRQASKVLLPVTGMKPNEIYAPGFRDGETVALIRYPHSGTFEIPQLVVNNKSKAAKAVMENAVDAVGIHPSVAKQLSGADFDGDAVLVIPNGSGAIKTTPALRSITEFDHFELYPGYEGMPVMSARMKALEMGKVSNLITDMTIKGATLDEIARAARHSMVVIDAEKHGLNYRQSYKDHGIAALQERYQDGGGASTLISKAGSELRVPHRKGGYAIDPDTGAKVHFHTGQTYVDGKGRTVARETLSTKMAEADDAMSLSSGRQIELVYAGHANELKALANQSRLDALAAKPAPYSPSARAAYREEYESLAAALNVAVLNAPRERQAQYLANSMVARKKQENPDLKYDKDALKKVRNRALAEARAHTGAKKTLIPVSDKEWEAIQAGAVSPTMLEKILANADLDRIKQLATPRADFSLSAAQERKARELLASGHSHADVADSLGVSISVLLRSLEPKN